MAVGAAEVLVKRLISGGGFAALVVVAITALPPQGCVAFLLILILVAAYEWAKLGGVASWTGVVGCVAAVAAVCVSLWLARGGWSLAAAAGLCFWALAAGVVLAYPASAPLVRWRPMVLAGGALALAGAWAGLLTLRVEFGAAHLVWLLVAVAAADSGAYFAGRRFGRRKLAPRVSPGKTWEGLAGGAAAALVCGALGGWWFDGRLGVWLGIGAAVFLASVLGDLTESVLKRVRGVKDSGGLLPGHGGLLDRVDSVLPAAPTFALLLPLGASPAVPL